MPCHRPGGPAATLVDVVYPATDAFNDPIKKICRKAAVAAVDHNRPVRVNGELGKMVRRTPSNRPDGAPSLLLAGVGHWRAKARR